MRYKEDGKKALTVLLARAKCKLAEVHRLLAPNLEEPYTAAQLLEVAEERLATLPAHQQEQVRLRAVVAYAELDQLVAEMARHLTEVGDELRAVRARTQAVTAYQRAPRPTAYAHRSH